MSNIQIQDVDQRIQYTATGGQTIFTVPFPFLANSDLVVYQNSTLLDLGVAPGEYGISGAGNPSGGTVTLVTGATANDIITIYGNQPIDRTSIYSATISNLTGSDLNNDFNREIIMLKQLWTTQNLLQLQYNPYAEVSQDETVTTDRWIPILAAGQLWRKNAGDTAIEAVDGPTSGGIAGTLYTYLTLTDQTSELPNSTDLSALASGFLVNNSGTAILSRTFAGTTNQLAWTYNDGISGNPTVYIVDNPVIPGTEGLGVPQGTTAQRPGSPSGTNLRFNTTTVSLEFYNGTDWTSLSDDVVQYLPLIGGTMSGNIDMGGNKVTNAADPTSNSDYVTLSYLNGIIYNVHPACVCSSTANLTATYDNGVSGVGATLTNAGAMAAFSVDGISPNANDRVLIKDQTNQFENGIYTVTTVGDGATNWVLTRATDYDEAGDMQAGDRVIIIQGTLYALTVWVMTQTAAITVGTTNITWQQVPAGSGALLIANNLSDVADAATSRTNLGLGSIATQAASSVAITGGTIDGTVIGGVIPAAGTFTTLVGTTTQGGNILLTDNDIQHVGDTDNKIVFGTDTQSYETGGSSRLDISNSGVRMGAANARVTTILDEDTMASDSDTSLATQQSIKQYVDQYAPNAAQPNIIIGGNFSTNPWQRGTSFASATGYTADRFPYYSSGSGVVTVLKTADSPTASEAGVYSDYCYHVDVTTADTSIAAGDYYVVQYFVEGYDISLAGFGQSGTRYITLSFWHKHTVTGTYCVGFTNSATNRSYVAEYTQAVTDTWEKSEITVPVDNSGTWLYTNGAGLIITFGIAVGSTFQTTANTWSAGLYWATSNQVNGMSDTANNFKLDLIKLELGDVATPYPIENENEILDKSKRYYQKLNQPTSFMGQTALKVSGTASFKSMRTTPTFSLSTTLSITDGTTDYTQSSSDITTIDSNEAFFYGEFANFAGLTQYRPYAYRNDSSFLICDAEL